jgi:hypothetical protein
MLVPLTLGLGAAGIGVGAAIWQARKRALDRWLLPYLLHPGRRHRRRHGEPVHLLLCFADHFEPKLGGAPPATARARVRQWVEEYPVRFGAFHDNDGRPPRHSFFYPEEEYEPDYLDAVAGLCRAGFGEVEVHLHHDRDTADGLREKLVRFRDTLVSRHGLLARHRLTGEVKYGFIHGNWALDNSRPDGRWCGVNSELDVLRETGCYADFTLPSAPDPTQTRKINSIYYAVDDPARPKSHDNGTDVGSAPQPDRSLMLIQGPLLLNWRSRKWGTVPRVENACLQGNQPPSAERLDQWLRARVHVRTRPDWVFIKLHTHGANEANYPVLLGEAMVQFHKELARRAAVDPAFQFHYVTAREMYNLARAAEAGWTGGVAEVRDYELVWNGARACTGDSGGET